MCYSAPSRCPVWTHSDPQGRTLPARCAENRSVIIVSAWTQSAKSINCTKYELKAQEMCIPNRNYEEIPCKKHKNWWHISNIFGFAGFLEALTKNIKTITLRFFGRYSPPSSKAEMLLPRGFALSPTRRKCSKMLQIIKRKSYRIQNVKHTIRRVRKCQHILKKVLENDKTLQIFRNHHSIVIHAEIAVAAL